MTGYITVEDLKEHMGDISHSAKDEWMEVCIEAASRSIDHFTQRQFTTLVTAESRVFHAHRYDKIRVDDFYSTNSFVLATDPGDSGTFGTTWGTNDYELYPLNGRRGGLTVPYNEIRAVRAYTFPTCTRRATVRVTAKWGFSSIPWEVLAATRLIAGSLVPRSDQPQGVVGDMDPVRISRYMDADAARYLAPFRQPIEAP
jgi:hypothetical protein